MDNSNLSPNQPTPNQPMPNQPMPNQQMGFGQPMPNYGQPTQPIPNQPMTQPYPMQPNMAQPYPVQPAMKPPKQPMDPAKKKKIILIASICSGVAILGIAAAIIIPILLRVDYSSAYKTAKELKPKIEDIYRDYDCKYVVEYVASAYTSVDKYNEYVANCSNTFSSDTTELVENLGSTAGVQRNTDLKNQYDKFRSEYDSITAGGTETLESKLKLYQAWHNYAYNNGNSSFGKTTDAEYTTIANYLIDSGNESFKAYGEKWLEKVIALSAARRAYDNASWSAANYSELRNNYNNLYNEMKDWVASNKPDIKSIAPLNLEDTSKVNTEFSKLYSMIADTYSKNYNSGSGDCAEFSNEVYCE